MNLSDVYSKQVSQKKVNMLSVGGDFPQIERDPTIKNLENDVLSRIRSLIPQERCVNIPQNTISSLSVEDALKELLDFSKK